MLLALIGLSPSAMATQRDPEEIDALFVDTYLCEAGETPGNGCEPLAGVTIVVTGEDGTEFGSCVTDLYEASGGVGATCYVEVPYDTTVVITEDVSTVPAGYSPVENPRTAMTPPSLAGGGPGPATIFVNVAQERTEPDETPADTDAEPAPDVPVATTAPTESPGASAPSTEPGAAGTGSPAAIFAGDCDIDFAEADAVAVLSELTGPQGEQRGSDTATAVETSFTTLDLPLDDILAEDHVLVVFDQDDDSVVLACGAIGGILTEDGSLASGLSAVDESRFSGVAYFTGNGDQTDATIFLAEDLSAESSPAA